jgi:hypothetical protein
MLLFSFTLLPITAFRLIYTTRLFTNCRWAPLDSILGIVQRLDYLVGNIKEFPIFGVVRNPRRGKLDN